MAHLHIMGYKLTEYQKDLTPLQRNFLFYAVPKAMRRMHGQTEQESDRDKLRQKVKQRMAARNS